MMRACAAGCAALVASGCMEDRPAPAAGAPPELADVGAFIGPQPGVPAPFAEAANPLRGDAEAAMEGRRLFVWYNCAGCHGGHAGGGMGPSLRDSVWLYGGGDADIYNSIVEGRAYGMPAWGLKLPREQIWKIVAYIQTLGTPEEAAPPPPMPQRPSFRAEPTS
jgi:cytochrome c oxidase cbb3-type subunit III